MAFGLSISRQWVRILDNGVVIVDWGDGVFQDIHTGKFFEDQEEAITFPIQGSMLNSLKRAGLVDAYNDREVIFKNLPKRMGKE